MSGTPITNTDAVVSDNASFETICDFSGFRLRKGDSLVENWQGFKGMPRFTEGRHPQDAVRARQYDNEGATSIRPRQTDRFVNGSTWNGSSWDLSTGGVPAVTADDL